MGSANSQQVVRRRMEILFMLSPLYKSTRQIFESLISKGFEIPDIRLVQIDLKELRNDFPLNIEYRKDQNGVFQYKLPSHNSENKRKNSSMSPREAICFQIACYNIPVFHLG